MNQVTEELVNAVMCKGGYSTVTARVRKVLIKFVAEDWEGAATVIDEMRALGGHMWLIACLQKAMNAYSRNTVVPSALLSVLIQYLESTMATRKALSELISDGHTIGAAESPTGASTMESPQDQAEGMQPSYGTWEYMDFIQTLTSGDEVPASAVKYLGDWLQEDVQDNSDDTLQHQVTAYALRLFKARQEAAEVEVWREGRELRRWLRETGEQGITFEGVLLEWHDDDQAYFRSFDNGATWNMGEQPEGPARRRIKRFRWRVDVAPDVEDPTEAIMVTADTPEEALREAMQLVRMPK